MAADAWSEYDGFKEYLGEGYIDLDGDNLKMALFLSTSNAATLTNNVYGDLTNELANGNGYLTGGIALTGVTWTRFGGTTTFDANDPTLTASGGTLTFRFAVIYVDKTITAPTGTVTRPLICFSLLDNTPADVSVASGNTLTFQMNASGILTLS